MAASLQLVKQPHLSEHNQFHNDDGNNNKQGQVQQQTRIQKVYKTYIGVSFAVFLSILPKNAYSMQSQNKHLVSRLRKAEEELYELRSRRQEDSKANARVVEIFATHRNAWQQEERRLLRRLDDSSEEISRLRSRIAEIETREAQLLADADELRRQVAERDELLNFMSRHQSSENGDEGGIGLMFQQMGGNGFGGSNDFDSNCLSSSDSSKFWGESRRPNLWQDIQYESIEPTQHVKQFAVRRESPWKVDGESIGVPSKLKLLEEELVNLDKVGNSSSPKVASSMRKQAKRYQDLAAKIDGLCRRMQASDPIEPTLSSEFRSQRQTEFLLDAFQLQQRASETGKKLMSLQTEIYTSCIGNELGFETKIAMRKSLDNIRNNFKDIQRNLEIWLARIMGDLEGILARDGASRSRDYYFPRYPSVNSYNS
ncbi:Ankyrin repeat domain-containing protein 35 [Bienertia sinuspersici]